MAGHNSHRERKREMNMAERLRNAPAAQREEVELSIREELHSESPEIAEIYDGITDLETQVAFLEAYEALKILASAFQCLSLSTLADIINDLDEWETDAANIVIGQHAYQVLVSLIGRTAADETLEYRR
jgi:hypothetical protein